MNLVEIMQPDFVHSDARGTLTQLVHGGYRQINGVFTKAGMTRGGFHYHKRNTEAFFVLSGRLRLTAALDGKREQYEFATGALFRILPMVRHSFDFLEDTYLIGMYDGCVAPADGDGEKDIYPDEG